MYKPKWRHLIAPILFQTIVIRYSNFDTLNLTSILSFLFGILSIGCVMYYLHWGQQYDAWRQYKKEIEEKSLYYNLKEKYGDKD